MQRISPLVDVVGVLGPPLTILNNSNQMKTCNYALPRCYPTLKLSLHKKWSVPLRFSSVNMTKSAVSCGFGRIYWRNPQWKISCFVQYFINLHTRTPTILHTIYIEIHTAYIILFITYFLILMLCYVQMLTLCFLRSNILSKICFLFFRIWNYFKWFK